MRHMRFDKVTSAQGGVQRQLSSKNTSADDASELASVVARGFLMGAADAQEVEHRGLGLENGAAADGADFNTGHGNGDLEVAVDTGVG